MRGEAQAQAPPSRTATSSEEAPTGACPHPRSPHPPPPPLTGLRTCLLRRTAPCASATSAPRLRTLASSRTAPTAQSRRGGGGGETSFCSLVGANASSPPHRRRTPSRASRRRTSARPRWSTSTRACRSTAGCGRWLMGRGRGGGLRRVGRGMVYGRAPFSLSPPPAVQVDVWALGCLLYGLMYFQHPFIDAGAAWPAPLPVRSPPHSSPPMGSLLQARSASSPPSTRSLPSPSSPHRLTLRCGRASR